MDIRPDNVRLYSGGAPAAMEVHPDAWQGKPLTWTTGDPAVATVSQSGVLTPVGPGVTYVRAASGDSAHDASSVTVLRDPPVLDIGAADTTVAAGAALSFQAKVTQEYGIVAEFAWDLDGDGKDDSAGNVQGTGATVRIRHRYLSPGAFKAALKITDAIGGSATAVVPVTIKQDRPTADAGPDLEAQEGQPIHLRGRAADSLGHVVSREWKIGTGGFVPASDSGTTDFKAPDSAGTIPCVFRVTNDISVAAEDTAKITIKPSTVAALSALTISVGHLRPAFSPDSSTYAVDVWNTNRYITVNASTAGPTAALSIDGVKWDSGRESYPLDMAVGANTITVEVAAEDGVTKKTYSIKVNRSSSNPNTKLSNLTVSVGTLVPAFTPTTYVYDDTIPGGTAGLIVTPTAVDQAATIKVGNGNVPYVRSSTPVTVTTPEASTEVPIQVLGQDSVTQTLYYIHVILLH